MFSLELFKSAVDIVNIPFLFVKVIKKTGKIVDFEILYFNSCFNDNVLNVGNHTKYSQIKNKMTKSINFFEMANNAYVENKMVVNTYYSEKKDTWFSIEIKPFDNDFLVITLVDITAKIYYSEQLKMSIVTDVLTALPNRFQFYKDLDFFLANSDKKMGVLFFDIDNFKAINDSKGQQEGDRILIKSARLFKGFEKKNSRVYRFSADEFLILVSEVENNDKFIEIAQDVLKNLDDEGISLSCGISVYPDHSSQRGDLIKFADLAMHRAKKEGKHCVYMFSSEMHQAFLREVQIKEKMPQAFENGEFTLFFQPQFDIETSKLRGFEALLRWTEPELGVISPEEFIPLAEESGFILTLGEWVIKKGIECQKKWENNFDYEGIMSINVSPVQVMKSDICSIILKYVEQYNANPSHFEIEVTEGVLINETEKAANILKRIKSLGFGISLDDFGTGYSSLKYLHTLPLTTLKIDKSFIQSITSEDGVSENITNSIISMVTKMGIDTIAEGVEKVDQLLILQQLNCKTIQGFLRGKPMDEGTIEKFLSGELKL